MNRLRERSSVLLALGVSLGLLVLAGGCQSQVPSDSGQSEDERTSLGPPPLRFPHLSIRTEKYLIPAVSTGPLNPTWSPDGEWIAFSMRGDLWKVPAEGGTAIALTQGPGYYFEPAWSPDGETLAFSVDRGEQFDVGLVSAEGDSVRRIVTDGHVDVEPTWGPEGTSLYFVSDRGGEDLDIFSIDPATGDVASVVAGEGNQIQPDVSPDGQSLVYVSPVEGKPGSGGLWVKSLPDGEPTMIHYEETRYRAAPTWTPDGESLLYVSDRAGNNNVATLPAEGGTPIRLTHHQMDEFSPVMGPHGECLAFVSNRGGTTRLYTMPAGGGATEAWQEFTLSSRQPRDDRGKLRLRVLGPHGQPTPARVYLMASDGRAYTPKGKFHRVASVRERHYFHTHGSETVTVPAGTVRVEAVRGFEYAPDTASVVVPAQGRALATLRLDHLVDAPERGWYSGDTEVHDLHAGRWGLSHEDFFGQLLAEDLHVTYAPIHQDGTRLMGRWADLTGAPHPLSTDTHILQYAEEFRGSRGHVDLLGIEDFIMPLVGGTPGTAYSAEVLNARYLDAVQAEGGIGGFAHPFGSAVETPEDGKYSEIPLDVALGKGTFYNLLNIPYDALPNAEMYYRLLNSGFQLAVAGGSDTFADVWRDPPPGTDRTYALLGKNELSVDAWLKAVEDGQTFASNGPLLFVEIEGRAPGSEIQLTGSGPDTLQVQGEVVSLAPLRRVEVLRNGDVVHTINAREKGPQVEISVPVVVPENGWIAVRALGPSSRYVPDTYAFAQTTPVYILRNGERYTSAEDARFLRKMVEALWQSVKKRDQWHSEAGKKRYREAIERAQSVYQRIAEGTYSFEE